MLFYSCVVVDCSMGIGVVDCSMGIVKTSYVIIIVCVSVIDLSIWLLEI